MMSAEDIRFLIKDDRSYQVLRPAEDLDQAIPEHLDEFIEHNDFAPRDPNENDEEKMEFEQPIRAWMDIDVDQILREQEEWEREEDEIWADVNRRIAEDGIIDPNNPPRQPLSPVREDDEEWNELMNRFNEMVEIEENLRREIEQFWRREEQEFNNVGAHSDTSSEASFGASAEEEDDVVMMEDAANLTLPSDDEEAML